MSRSFFGSRRLNSANSVNKDSAMSIQKPQEKAVLKEQKQQSVDQVISNSFVARVHGFIQDSIDSVLKPTVVYRKTFPTQINGFTIKRKFVVFRQIDYIISGWTGTGFPNVIYIAHKSSVNFGYENELGDNTKKIAALELQQISPILDDAEVKTYDLRYTLRDGITWGIPPTQTEIEFEIYIDDSATPAELPLPNPMTIGFQFRYEKM